MMPDSGIVAAIATETGCSVATVATIEHSLKRRYGPKRAKPDQVRAAARHCRMLLDDLSANLPPASPAAGRLVEAHGLLHAGKPSEAEAALAQAEDLEIEAAKSADQAAALSATMSAAEIRKWRGQLQEILGDFRRAARHYMLANRHIPRDDYANRWRYTGRQVRSLIESAERFADVGAYAEASKICAEAIAVLPQKLADRPRNEARMQLAEILVCQANADGGVAALETATEHLRHACAYFSEHGPAERAGEAYTRRASALSQIAERSGNANALEAAVDSYIDLTASFSSEAADFDWQRINASLRRALESVGRHAAESNPGLAMQLRTKLDGLEKVAQAAPSGTAQKAEQLLPTGSD